MLLVTLLACIRLEEGDYTIDYAPVKLDTCDLFADEQAAEDDRGELSWDDGTLVFEMEGTDDDWEFEVDGKEFERESFGLIQLDDECALTTVQDDVGEMLSNTEFEGETHIAAEFQGNCTTWELFLDAPCLVEFDWEGELEE